MVKIVNFSEHISDSGKSFFSLEVQGGIEMIKSKKTDKFYMTVRTVSIPSTFNRDTCESLIGVEIEGRIEKQHCDPYQYTIKDTNEVVELDYTYQYLNEAEGYTESKNVKASLNKFSVNED